MDAIELSELIGRGEDSRTQFKKGQDVANAKSLADEIVAFANSKGGRLLIGIDDNGAVIPGQPGYRRMPAQSVQRNNFLPLIVSFATKAGELPYRGIGTGIRRALAAIPELELESDHERNLFIARIPRRM